VSRPKREPRVITLAEIEQTFELASYWWGTKWCPAVERTERGFHIRFIKSLVINGADQRHTFDYFELDADGVITVAPRGAAKDWKPGRVVDIEAAVARFATPRPEAMML
jgi:hypothetical protein